FPGLLLSALYVVYIVLLSWWKPHMAPALGSDDDLHEGETLPGLVLKAFVPPTILIGLVLGSIFLGWATPTEAAGVGVAGAVLLAIMNGKFTLRLMTEAVRISTLAIGMVFLIIIAAACFSYVFRSPGGDDVIHGMLDAMGLGPWVVLLLFLTAISLLGVFV